MSHRDDKEVFVVFRIGVLAWLLLSFVPVSVRAGGSAQRFDTLLREGVALWRTADSEGAVSRLRQAVEQASNGRDRAKAKLALARALTDAGRPRDALADLSRIAPGTMPAVLAEAAAWERARALDLAKDRAARKALADFVSRFPSSSYANNARLAWARIALAAGDRSTAGAQAAIVLKRSPSRLDRAEARLVLARAGASDGRDEALRRLFIEMPDTDAATRTGLQESDLSGAELDLRAQAFFDAKDYEAALRIHTGRYDAGDRSASRALTLGRLHLVHVRDDADKAIGYLRQAQEGGALSGPAAHLLFGRAYAKAEDYDRALDAYRAYLKTGAQDGRVRAMYYLGWLPYDRFRYEEALPEFDRFLAAFPRDRMRSYILWFKAWSQYQLGRYEDALETFDAMIPLGNNLVAGKAMYWGGRAHKAMGNDVEARAWMTRVIERYPLSYYAVLGAQRLNEWDGTPLPGWIVGPSPGLPDPGPLWPFDRIPKSLRARLQAVKDLGDLGETQAARTRYRAISRRVESALPSADRARFLRTVADATGEYNALFKRAHSEFSGRLGRVPTPESAPYWMVRYPRAERPIALPLAARFKMPELWTYAIMRQESRYDARQVSHTAALGIMQMIPATAWIVSRALDVPLHVETFFDTGRNVLFCMYYLAQLLDDFKGQIVFASAAYNAGAPPIKRFLAAHRGRPFDEMVEFIPYNEGRNYARKVAEHLTRYAYLHLDPEARAALYRQLFPVEVDYDLGTAVDY